MLKIIRGGYILLHRTTPPGEDAVYYYKPGRTDLLIVRPEFKEDEAALALIVSQLQSAVERRKRLGGGSEEIRESCSVEQLMSEYKPELVLEVPARRWNYAVAGAGKRYRLIQ